MYINLINDLKKEYELRENAQRTNLKITANTKVKPGIRLSMAEASDAEANRIPTLPIICTE